MILLYFKMILSERGYHMPQITKGGKYIFGWTEFKNGKIAIPDKVVHEYGLDSKYILLMESSKKSGGFCVTSEDLILKSKLAYLILEKTPVYENKKNIEKSFIENKKKYCWVKFDNIEKNIVITEKILNFFDVDSNCKFLIVRGSSLAFDCIVRGPIVEKAIYSDKKIVNYSK